MPPLEIWKDIPGYVGVYQVSDLGRVKSLQRRFPTSDGRIINQAQKILKIYLRHDYPYIDLYKNGVGRCVSVARLVGVVFLAPPPPGKGKPRLKHRDGNFTNCAARNLDWYYQTNPVNPANRAITIVQCERSGEPIREWESAAAAARALDLQRSNITQACRGKIKSHGGFAWRYRDEQQQPVKSGDILGKRMAEDESLT